MTKQALWQILSQFVEQQIEELSFEQLPGGHINLTYKVEATLAEGRREKFLLQKFNTKVFTMPERVMENIHTVSLHLQQNAYQLKVLMPFHTKSGKWLHTEGEDTWRLFPYFENTTSYVSTDKGEIAWKAAWAFGHFLASLFDVDPQRLHIVIPGFHDGKTRARQLERAVQNASSSRLARAGELLHSLNDEIGFLQKLDTLALPLRVAHHDAKLSNVLLDSENLSPVAVVDLDTVMPGSILSDFGDLVRSIATTASEEEEDPKKVEFLLQRYFDLEAGFLEGLAGTSTEAERKALPLAGPWMTLLQCIRFLTDFLMGDTYYPVSHEQQNYLRAQNQWSLFLSMKQQLSDRLIIC